MENKPEKTHVKNCTQFKAVVYWKYKNSAAAAKKTGLPRELWSQEERKLKKNRKFHDSFDWIYSKEKEIVLLHDRALRILQQLVMETEHYTALIFVNHNLQELCILKSVGNRIEKIIDVNFTAGKNPGEIVFHSLKAAPINLNNSHLEQTYFEVPKVQLQKKAVIFSKAEPVQEFARNPQSLGNLLQNTNFLNQGGKP